VSRRAGAPPSGAAEPDVDDLLRRVLTSRVVDVLPTPTPLDRAVTLSERLAHPVFIKREDLTPVFSFKLRGAYNRIAQLDEAERRRGVIAASAGNHAQGVAFASKRLGLDCLIVMPRTTPAIKVDAVRRLGAEIELYGDSYSDAAKRCAELIETSGATYIPPFDDLDVIAGQGTAGFEILQQAPMTLGSIFVPVGGGGLASGVAAVVKQLKPKVKVIGVEPVDSDAMTRSLEAGSRVELAHVGIFADGVAVKQVGVHTLALCQRYLDDCITVTTDEICAAIQDGFLDTRTVLEGAGALGIAGLKRYAETGRLPPGPAVAIASGANIPFAKIGYVAERADVGQGREALFAVTIPERPGAFLAFCSALGARGVTEFNYRLGSRELAHIFVGVEVGGRGPAQALAAGLRAEGYEVLDLTDDEVAALHLRHLVGGRSAEALDEILLRFEFPERPGALLQFLRNLGSRWNISLFHYRNHGSAFGRVLAGLEVPPAERAELFETLEPLGFEYEDVTQTAAARFLLD
jgi:threonine dehydratase